MGDYHAKKLSSDEASDKYGQAEKELKNLRSVSIPQAKTDLKQAKEKAADSKKAAEAQRERMEAAAKKYTHEFSSIKVQAVSHFDELNKAHKVMKQAERTHLNAELAHK